MKNLTVNSIISLDVEKDISKTYIDLSRMMSLITSSREDIEKLVNSVQDNGTIEDILLELEDEDIMVEGITSVQVPLFSDFDNRRVTSIVGVPMVLTKEERALVPYRAFYSLKYVSTVPHASDLILDGESYTMIEQVTMDSMWELVASSNRARKDMTNRENFTVPYPSQENGAYVTDIWIKTVSEDGSGLKEVLVQGIPLEDSNISTTWDDSEDTFVHTYYGYDNGESKFTFSIHDPQASLNGFVMSSMDKEALSIISVLIMHVEAITDLMDDGDTVAMDYQKLSSIIEDLAVGDDVDE